MQSIPEHHVNRGIGLRGFPLPKGYRDADERRLKAIVFLPASSASAEDLCKYFTTEMARR